MNTDNPNECAPFWNYRWRLLLFYFGPLALLVVTLLWLGSQHVPESAQWWQIPAAGWDALNGRDFWVPVFWGFWMPWFNGAHGPIRGLKRIVFRDFNGNPTLPLAIPLMHGLVWSLCVHLGFPLLVKPLVFMMAFLLFDILMLRFDLLQIYAFRFAAPIGPKGILKSGLVIWWLFLGSGLTLIHRFGSDSPWVVLGSAALLIGPMQLVMYKRRRRPLSVPARRVAVIGAGWSGLYAAKWLMQSGVYVRLFEGSYHVGGLWRYDENAWGGVAERTFASSSNYYMHASDFPMETPPFPKHHQIQQFLEDYSDHFSVGDRVTFGAQITSVAKEDDQWVVRGQVGPEGLEDRFDAVVVSAGFNSQPRSFEERYAGFTGRVIHSAEYKHTDQVAEFDRILVVGLGESGADIAHECAQLRGKKVYASGSKQWFAGRFVAGGFPADTLMAPGIRTLLAPFFTQEIKGRKFVGGLIRTIWGNGGSGIPLWEPPVPWLHGFVTKSRASVADVHNGDIVPKGRVESCEGKLIRFEDGSSIEADLILDCSGFAPEFPFLDEDFCFSKLYRLVFNNEDPTLSFVGTARPMLGSIPGLAEMQARWVASVYSGRMTLPAKAERVMDGYFTQRAHRKRFFTSRKRPNLVDHEFYAGAIARDLRITVPWLRILTTAPRKFFMLVMAPWMAFKYNLRGRGRPLALKRIQDKMPQSNFYRNVIRKRFVGAGVRLLSLHLLLVAMAIYASPLYAVVAIGGVYLAQLLARNFGASVEAELDTAVAVTE